MLDSKVIDAAIFKKSGEFLKFISGTTKNLNMNINVSECWREVDRDVIDEENVPELTRLKIHKDHK